MFPVQGTIYFNFVVKSLGEWLFRINFITNRSQYEFFRESR